jgi:long-chain acyl-CoA synthetase
MTMRPTLHFDGRTIPPDAFHDRCIRAAAALHRLGVGQGDVVALMLYNAPETLELMLAARSIGADYCMVNWHFKSAEARHILADSEAKVLVVHANLLQQVCDGLPDPVRVLVVQPSARTRQAFSIEDATLATAHDYAAWDACRDATAATELPAVAPGTMRAYTSGTTGAPKGVRRLRPTPEQVQLAARMSRIALGIERGMRALMCAPMYHSAPCGYLLQAALQAAHIWIEARFEAEAMLGIIQRERISHVYVVPTMMRRLLQLPATVRARYDLGSLRFAACTGAPCPKETKQAMIEWWGPVIHEAYAASEFGYVTHIDSDEALRKPGSAGRAMPGAEVRIMSPSGEDLPAGSVGLIYVRQSAVTDFTYSNNDEARRRIERNGLWTLGDMGYLDGEGYLYVVDRNSDMVISGGVNIYPSEIEAVLGSMPGIADCAVFGVPDDEFGEKLMAAVQPVAGATLSAGDVQSYVRQRLANYKVPRDVVFHAQLPREDTGKIFKRKLREPYWVGANRRI